MPAAGRGCIAMAEGQRTDQHRLRALCNGGAVIACIVLLWANLGRTALSVDEQFTAVHARLPFWTLWRTLARDDGHPPLDYLLRKVVVESHDSFWMRAPSALIASATLCFVWWWMRRRGWFGCSVIMTSAVFPFFLLYGRTARMYALLILSGVVTAWLATSWLHAARRRLALALGVVLTLALFADNTSTLLALGALTLPGWRSDRQAWWWRAGAVVPVVIWTLGWAHYIPGQLASGPTSWIPYTTPAVAFEQIGRIVALVHPEFAVLAVAAMVAGGWFLGRQDRQLGRVVLCLGALPVVLTVVAGVWAHVLLARSLAIGSFCAILALAGLIEEGRRQSARALALAVVMVVVLIAPSIRPSLTFEEESGPAMRALIQRSSPGDVVILSPRPLRPLFEWTFDVRSTSSSVPGLRDARVEIYRRPGKPSPAVWVLAHQNAPWAPPSPQRCPDESPPRLAAYTLDCYLRPHG